MRIGVVITEPNQAAAMIRWADLFARGRTDKKDAAADPDTITGVAVLVVQINDAEDPSTQASQEGVIEEIALDGNAAAQQTSVTLAAARTAIRELDPQAAQSTEARDESAQATSADQDESPAARFVIRRITGGHINWAAQAVLQQIKTLDISLLLTPKQANNQTSNDALALQLFRSAPCDIVVMRPTPQSPNQQAPDQPPSDPTPTTPPTTTPAPPLTGDCRILAPTSGGPHATEALKLAVDVVDNCTGGYVDALFIEPPVGDDAEYVGEHLLESYIAQAGVTEAPRLRRRVILASNPQAGIAQAAGAGYDLILVGASNEWFMRKVLFSTVPPELMKPKPADETASGGNEKRIATLAVMRRAMPIHRRFSLGALRHLERTVPQLDRNERVSLVAKIQSNSQFDFDFVALICLSTAIAALGLARNSAAVVIGAMLVAPLMTPLVGAGLALVQANAILIRNAARAVILGFLLAFAIGLSIGWLTPGFAITSEMLARGSPNVLDLVVAFLSGLAAAYATARPNLSAALPGVAIAAALVPPIATSGMALATGDFALASGAALLFFTNIVAIILGAAGALWAVGNRSQHTHSGRVSTWVRPVTLSLVIAATALGVWLSYTLYQNLPTHKTNSTAPAALVTQLQNQLNNHPNTQLIHTEYQHDDSSTTTGRLHLQIASPAPLPTALIDHLANTAALFLDRRIEIHVTTQLRSSQSAAPPPPSIGPTPSR